MLKCRLCLDVHNEAAAAFPWSGREYTPVHTHTYHVHSTNTSGWSPGSSSSLSLFSLTGELEGKLAVSQAHLPDWEAGWSSTSPKQEEEKATSGLLNVGRKDSWNKCREIYYYKFLKIKIQGIEQEFHPSKALAKQQLSFKYFSRHN